MTTIALLLVFATAAAAFLIPSLPFETRFLNLLLYLPAVLIGIPSYLTTRSFGRSKEVLLCILLAFAGVLWSDEAERGRGLLIAGYLAITLPIASLIVARRCLTSCMHAFLVSSLFAFAVCAMVSSDSYEIALGERFGVVVDFTGSVVSNPNEVGAAFGFAALLAFILTLNGAKDPHLLLLKSRGAHYFVYLGSAGVLLLGMILTGSRGAFLATSASLFVPLLHWRAESAKIKATVVMLVFLATLCGTLFLYVGASPAATMQMRFTGDDTVTLGGRTAIWADGISAMVSETRYLVRGTGTGSAEQLLGQYNHHPMRGRDGILRKSPHNTILEWWMCFGILGSIPAGFLLYRVIQVSWNLDQVAGSAERRAILVFMILFSFDGVIYRLPFWPAIGALLLVLLSSETVSSIPVHSRT